MTTTRHAPMMFFASHDAQTLADLSHGGQLAGCRRLAKHPPTYDDGFCWEDAPRLATPLPPTVTVRAKTDALDAADLMTCYSCKPRR